MKKLFTTFACVGVIAISAISADAASSKLYIIGQPAGEWKANLGTELDQTEPGVFTYSANFAGPTSFGFADQLGSDAEDWNTLNSHRYGAPKDGEVPSGKENPMTYGTGNAWMLPAGEYEMTIDTNTMNLSLGDKEVIVEIGDLYLRGGMNEWATTDAWKFTKEGDVYTLTEVTIPANKKFKVGNADWSFSCTLPWNDLSNIVLDKVYNYEKGGSDNNMSFAQDTKVTVIVNTADETIEFKNEGTAVEPPVDPYTYMIHGQIFGNSSWESIALTNNNGKWEYTGTLVSGEFGIKKMKGTEQADWISAAPDYVNITTDGTYNAMYNGTNWQSELEGNYTISFDPQAMTVTFTKYEGEIEITVRYAIRGTITTGSIDYWVDLDMTYNDKGEWEWTGEIVPGSFGIKKLENEIQKAWYASVDNPTIAENGTFNSKENGTNWNCELSGKHSFTFNPETLVLTISDATGIDNIEAAEDVNVVYYNLQGVRVENPANGVFVRVANGKATKVVK